MGWRPCPCAMVRGMAKRGEGHWRSCLHSHMHSSRGSHGHGGRDLDWACIASFSPKTAGCCLGCSNGNRLLPASPLKQLVAAQGVPMATGSWTGHCVESGRSWKWSSWSWRFWVIRGLMGFCWTPVQLHHWISLGQSHGQGAEGLLRC